MRPRFLPLLAVFSALAFAASHAQREKPNVLVILADDLGYGIVNSYGGDPERVTTPHIDKLAADGARFTDAYVSCSVCGPSRAGLMTGRYQQRFGIYANCDTQSKDSGAPPDQTMMPRYFKDAGYATAMIGKWHLGVAKAGQHPLDKGFDEYFGFNSAQTDFFKSPILFDGRTKIGEHDYLTHAFTDHAISFIEKTGEQPFFVYLAYNAVHGPNQAPKETIAKYATKMARNDAVMAAMVEELDTGIGRVLASLEKTGKAKNTLVFFLSDNGGLPYWWDGSNGKLRGFKRFQYDGGNKVPFIVRWPAEIPAGQVRKQLAISLDIIPTALDAAGLKAPNKEVLDGISLLPSLKEAKDLRPERLIYWAGSHLEEEVTKDSVGHDNPPPAWGIRQGDWKLLQIMEQGPQMLFNIANDPSESVDLIEENPEIASELRKAWLKWFPICGTPIAWKAEYFQQLKNLR
ncbi:sulfatase [Luteolibacter algae]|uniref:Sulfatase n=1 Tax=Luteolibacter algae TaxID=454151 RepID=A0ABW5D7Y8_9BACT